MRSVNLLKKKLSERPHNELLSGFAGCRGAFVALGIASAIINVLYLSGSVYMLEVYDRVLPSRSIPTLMVSRS